MTVGEEQRVFLCIFVVYAVVASSSLQVKRFTRSDGSLHLFRPVEFKWNRECCFENHFSDTLVVPLHCKVQETIRKIFPIIVPLTTDEPICKVSLLIEPRLANVRVAIDISNRCRHIFTFAASLFSFQFYLAAPNLSSVSFLRIGDYHLLEMRRSLLFLMPG